jgi:predicted nucleic acid-binding protein
VQRAITISQREGLLMNDSLVVVAMREQRISNLASNDADFDRVQGIIRYAPV